MPQRKPYRRIDKYWNEKQLLRDFGSGLNDVIGRGTIAGLLGAPADIANLGENGIRALLGKKPVTAWGGQEHIGKKMQDLGLVSNVRRPKTELVASLLSPTQIATATLRSPQYAKLGLKMLDNLDAPNSMRNWAQRGAIDVWHGSPHKFDEFKAMDNIGGGEGAQAYGHGGYHASNKDVALDYQLALGNKPKASDDLAGFDAQSAIAKSKGNPKKAVAWLENKKAETEQYRQFLVPGAYEERMTNYDEAIRRIQSGDVSKTAGNLYRNQLRWPDPVREATDPLSDKHFLDWDKPLSEQTPEVRQVINGLGERYQISDGQTTKFQNFPESFTGRDLYKRLGISERYNSKELADIGIPGIRYLDGGSRSAGQGSHNYVTFDDALVNIMERNGQTVGSIAKTVGKAKAKP